MTKIDLPYVKVYADRHGKLRYYFRRRGYSMPLPPPGSADFMAAYETARAAFDKGERTAGGKIAFMPGSLGWAIVKFMASAQYVVRGANTKRGDRRIFDALQDEDICGAMLRDLQHRHVKQLRDRFRSKYTASIADAMIDKLSVLWQFADEHLPDARLEGPNPTTGVKRLHTKHQEREPWPAGVFEAFEAYAPGHLRLAVMLLLYTGQRRSDIVRMKWSQYDGEIIEVPSQVKTGEYVAVPCHQKLKAILEGTPRRGEFIQRGERGDSLMAGSLTVLVRRVLKRAGVSGYSVHGLRKNAAQNLAEAGCSVSEIMAITGHRSVGMAMHYAKRAEKKRMARSAIAKLEAADRTKLIEVKKARIV